MVIYHLENEVMSITVSDHGAELQSINEKNDGTDYLWNGDPTFWKYRSPILFPIVGKLVDGQYRVDGQTYALPAHGLGRISEFTMIEQKDSSVTFELKYSEESLKVYPYRFALQVTYTLKGNKVIVSWAVQNIDHKTIYFSIGAHPAFMCPIVQGDKLEDCYLAFNRKEDLDHVEITPECYLKRTKASGVKDTGILPLAADTFKDGVRVYDSLKSDSISIRSRNNDKILSVTARDFSCWGIWSPEKGGAPFICIEPWHGHADYEDFTGEFKDKEGNISLMRGKTFETQYEITIG